MASTADEAVVLDPLKGLKESQRLALLIRFGAAGSDGGMCAGLSHGHSFQSSIFRLPAKCAGCHELVWGPFTRGCTCLTCSLTVHRSCTGMATIPQCPTKRVFEAFCRSELGLPPVPPATTSRTPAAAAGSQQGAGGLSLGKSPASGSGGAVAAGSGDLDEWATVDGTSSHSASVAAPAVPSPHRQQPPASASCALHDLGSSFSWSPLGLSERKRTISAGACEQQQQQYQQDENDGVAVVPGDARTQAARDAGDAAGATARESQGAIAASSTAGVTTRLAVDADASASVTSRNNVGIRGVTKMSVAGGVVGAFFGGPAGAVVGLKLGAVLGAGRSVQQGLWQRIETNRREAGAEGILLPKVENGSAAAAVAAAGVAEKEAAREPLDAWARISEQVEREHRPIIWELDTEQGKLLEQGECDAGEVAMFVVGKVLADETSMLFHLYAALLAEFRSRHGSCDRPHRPGPVPIRRRSSDTDMVALFPRSSSRRGSSSATAAAIDDGGFFASTPGLEKTFSFVEEAEIVEGEGSDTPGFGDDGDADGGGGSSDKRDGRLLSTRAGHWNRAVRSGEAALVSTPTSPARTAAVASAVTTRRSATVAAAGAVASKDWWRNNSTRLDSWVQLEGGVCSSCGGREAGRNSQNGRSTRALARDVDEDDGELGEGWAAAEVPVCWCRDEGGISASPEDAQMCVLTNVPTRRGAATDGSGDSVEAAPDASSAVELEEMVSQVGTDRGDQSALDRRQHSRCTAGAGAAATEVAAIDGKIGGEEEAIHEALRDVHGVLRELTRGVLEWCPLLTASHEAQIQAVNCIDQRVFSETYGPVFRHIASLEAAREGDTSLARRVQGEERSRAADGRPSLLSTCRPEVMSALRAAGSARTGRDKLGFLVQAVERVGDALPEQPTTDALIFSVCRHLAAATTVGAIDCGGGDDAQPALPQPHAEVAFVEQFMRDESWVMGKQGYVLTTVIAALHVLNDPDMSDDIFLDAPPPPPPPPPLNAEGGDLSFVVEDAL